MNSSVNQRAQLEELISRNFTIVFFGFTIICINGTFIYTFFKNPVFHTDPRYILYVHMVVNDMLMVWISVTLSVMSYILQNVNMALCSVLLIVASTTQKITPLNLAGMAVERYIAICKPLHHPHICTVHRTYILISLIWVVGALPALANLIIALVIRPFNAFDTVLICASSLVYVSAFHDERNKAVQGIYTSAVWIIMVFTYCRVLLTARRMSTDKVSARKAQSTILLHGVQMLLCMLSFATPVLDTVLVALMPAYQRDIRFWDYVLTNIFPRLLSPLIYGVRDQTFAKHMRKIYLHRMFIIKIESVKKR